MKPLAVTLGDVTGIGPEVALRAAAAAAGEVPLVLVGDPAAAEEAAGRLGLRRLPAPVEAEARVDPALVFAGRVEARAGEAARAWVEEAARRAVAGDVAGIVTAPISKAAWAAAGHGTDGHTEFLADLVGGRPLMLLVGPTPEGGTIRVALATTHLPLRDVPRRIATESVADALFALSDGLRRDLGLDRPRIGLLALNPHAGEGGALGHEEAEILAPTVEHVRGRGIDVEGPIAADAAFAPRARGRYDAFLAMYHDQGLGPLKALAGGAAVNVTLGLPIVRTSPDHGVAHDIAGKGVADFSSMRAAIALAAEITKRRSLTPAPGS